MAAQLLFMCPATAARLDGPRNLPNKNRRDLIFKMTSAAPGGTQSLEIGAIPKFQAVKPAQSDPGNALGVDT